MSGFRVGDRVRVTGDTAYLAHPFDAGTVGVITEVLLNAASPGARVKPDGDAAWWVGFADLEPVDAPAAAPADSVAHPAHYLAHPSGVECITITEHMGFCLGNVVKYVWRAGLKTPDALRDLKKARWYLNREIDRLEAASWSEAKPLQEGETL